MTQIFITIATMKPLRRGKKGMGLNSLDSIYIENGHYPLIDDTPEFDPSLQTISNELVIDEPNKVVNRVYTLVDLTAAEIRLRTVPRVISMRQARLALLSAELLTTVSDAIATGTEETLKIEWEYATEVRRDWASLITLVTSLELTELQVDDLFILGATL